MMRVLVVFGSKMGGTAGLAVMIGDALRKAGCEAIVSPAREVHDVSGVDAVIAAGALYAGRWHRDARRFVRRNATALRALPVWLVSSGPLDDTATQHDIAPTRHVEKLAALVGARGHVTFGGRLAPDAKGFPARAMAKTHAGDWRDPAQVRAWVAAAVNELPAPRTVPDNNGKPCPIDVEIDEHEGRTRAKARWSWRGNKVVGVGFARLDPADPPVAAIGEELAIARALSDLASRLFSLTESDIEASTHKPVVGPHQ